MTFDPITLVALFMFAAWTMTFAGMKKHALELRQRRRRCPSSGRRIDGRVCREH
jgi:hypothetical protein